MEIILCIVLYIFYDVFRNKKKIENRMNEGIGCIQINAEIYDYAILKGALPSTSKLVRKDAYIPMYFFTYKNKPFIIKGTYSDCFREDDIFLPMLGSIEEILYNPTNNTVYSCRGVRKRKLREVIAFGLFVLFILIYLYYFSNSVTIYLDFILSIIEEIFNEIVNFFNFF